MIGSWTFKGDSGIGSLVLSQDGAYEAKSWPRGLLCSEVSVAQAGDVNWEDLVEFSGTWQMPDEENPYLLLFSIDSDECINRSWSTEVWENDFGPYEMNIYLQSADPGNLSDDQVVRLVKAP